MKKQRHTEEQIIQVLHEAQAGAAIEHWRHEYNRLRPHSSIGRIPPDSFALTFLHPQSITNSLNLAVA